MAGPVTDRKPIARHELGAASRGVAEAYVAALREHWGDAPVAAVLLGSVARGEAGPTSDVDLLLVMEGLPEGRLARHRYLEPADAAVEPLLEGLRERGVYADLSPIPKTPAEAVRPAPLYLDLTEDAVILYDRDGFFRGVRERLRASLRRLGARRLRLGSVRYRELKPDYLPGDVCELSPVPRAKRSGSCPSGSGTWWYAGLKRPSSWRSRVS